MEPKKPLLVVLPVVLGLLMGFAYLAKVKGLRDQIRDTRETVKVITVNRPLAIGDTLEEAFLVATEWPKASVPRRAVLAEDLGLLAGRSLIHPLPGGEPVLWTDIPEGPRVQFSTEHIPVGFRAVALPAEEIRTLSHLLQPGDRVDIIWTRPLEGSSRLSTTVLGEGVAVLAVGGRLNGDLTSTGQGDAPSSITLLARPELALSVCQALQGGEVFLLARNRDEKLPGTPSRALFSPVGPEGDAR